MRNKEASLRCLSCLAVSSGMEGDPGGVELSVGSDPGWDTRTGAVKDGIRTTEGIFPWGVYFIRLPVRDFLNLTIVLGLRNRRCWFLGNVWCFRVKVHDGSSSLSNY